MVVTERLANISAESVPPSGSNAIRARGHDLSLSCPSCRMTRMKLYRMKQGYSLQVVAICPDCGDCIEL